MNRKILIISVIGTLLVISGLIISAMLSHSDPQDSELEKSPVIPANRSQEDPKTKIAVPKKFENSKKVLNISRTNKSGKIPDASEDIAEGPANLADRLETTETPIQIGEKVYEDFTVHIKSGDIACWSTLKREMFSFLEINLSSKIYKYCMYGWGDNGKVHLSGLGFDEETFKMLENKFDRNDGNPIVFLPENWHDEKTNYNETIFHFVCKTHGCNVPGDIPNLFKHNLKPDIQMIIL